MIIAPHPTVLVVDVMAATWRDTLYLYKGNVVIEKQHGSNVISWSGRRINCPECPDARAAAMPTERAFSSSLVKFDLMGSITDPVSNAKIVSLVDGTWDHAGEGGDKSHAAQGTKESPTKDFTHKLDLSRWLKDPRPFQKSLVLGSGHNKYGRFIELGWIEHGGVCRLNLLDDDGKREGTLLLARRYLPIGDERSTWSFPRMFSEMQLGIPPLVNEDVWSHVIDFVGISRYYFVHDDVSPWNQHAILHSGRYMTKRSNNGALIKIKKGPAGLLGPAPRLKMPTLDGTQFELRFVSSDEDGNDPIPNTTWMKQCWGCGESGVKEELNFDCRWTMLLAAFPGDVAVPFRYIRGEFCCNQCVLRAIPKIANLCVEWIQTMKQSSIKPLWLTTIDEGNSAFWDCVEQDTDAWDTMTKAGWKHSRTPYEGWVLRLP